MCPHVSLRAHKKTAIFKKKPTRLQSRRDCGMKTCGSKSTTDWISWLRWMMGICSFVTWFTTVTEWAFSPYPDCRPLRLSKTEVTAFIQDRLDSRIFWGIQNNSLQSVLILGEKKLKVKEQILKCQYLMLFVIITLSLQMHRLKYILFSWFIIWSIKLL